MVREFFRDSKRHLFSQEFVKEGRHRTDLSVEPRSFEGKPVPDGIEPTTKSNVFRARNGGIVERSQVMLKWTKRVISCSILAGGIAAVCVMTGASSYVKSSTRLLQSAVKDSIPIEFEIQRARDLLHDLVPELRANVRLVAAEEVEVANLEKEIEKQNGQLETERDKVKVLRTRLSQPQVTYHLAGLDYGREELVVELSRRFEHLRTAEKLLEGKHDLLKNRKRSLRAATQKLEKTRLARVHLAAEIEALEGQFRLIQAQSSDTQFTLDDSKLAQTRQVIAELKNRLEVSQRVLAREANFVEHIPVELVNESSVVERVDEYFDGGQTDDDSSVVVAP